MRLCSSNRGLWYVVDKGNYILKTENDTQGVNGLKAFR